MPKSKKRRRHQQVSSSISNLEVAGVGASAVGTSNSIESCLEELEALSGVQDVLQLPPQPTKEEALEEERDDEPDDGFPRKKKAIKISRITDEGDDEKKASPEQQQKLWDPSLGSFTTKNNDLFTSKREGILKWNMALNLWSSKSGQYTHNLLPSFEVEVARHFQIEKLSSFLLKSCKTKQLKMPAFERWVIDSKIEERERLIRASSTSTTTSNTPLLISDDPVLCYAKPNYKSSQRLAEEMKEAEMSSDDIKKTIKELCRRTSAAIEELRSQTKRYSNKIPLQRDKIELEKHDKIYSLIFRCKKWKKPFVVRVASSHYHKLRETFLYTHNKHVQTSSRNNNIGASLSSSSSSKGSNKIRYVENGKTTKALHAFHYILMTVLLRYSSLSGGQLLLELRGGGMQGAIHGEVFHTLKGFFSPRGKVPIFECFASPLNSYLPNFSSAFPDIDYHFGSVGNFLDLSLDEGVCEANPPFSSGAMTAMVDKIEQCLKEANGKNKSLVFVVVVPTVQQHPHLDVDADNDDNDDESLPTNTTTRMAVAKSRALPSFLRMISSPSCTHHLILKAREHGYVEAAQHLRLTRYKSSIFDTSVIILQSERSVRKCKLNEEQFEEKIRESFASRHSQELQERKREEEESGEA